MSLTDIVSSALTCAQILGGVLMFAWSMPRRSPERARAVAAGCFFVAWTFVIASVVPVMLHSGRDYLQAVVFVVTLGVSFCLVRFLFDSSVWAALFCASAGYTMQNLASSIGSFCIEMVPELNTGIFKIPLTMVAPFVAVYTVCYAVLIRKVKRDGLDLIRPQVALPMIISVIFAVICFDVVVKSMSAAGTPFSLMIACRLAHAMLCVLILTLEYELLYNRRLLEEVVAVQCTMESARQKYRLSKETIDAINLKCHDIRHQIRQIAGERAGLDREVVDEITNEVKVYDSLVRTGNEPLDVILTEKSLTCSQEGITLSCIADGACLSFVRASDLYALVGNAVDNAVRAVLELEDPELRSVSVVIRRMANMAVIHVENYFEGELEFEGGLPRTTQADRNSHGYGMKSMQTIARRYNGTLHVRTQGNVFHLNVMLPIPA